MSDESKKSMFSNSKFFQKLKGIKHIELIVAVILAAIVLLIYFSTFKTSETSTEVTTYQKTTASEYASYLETKLSSSLSQIKGAGTVKVAITLASGCEYVYAKNTETKSNSVKNGSNETTTSTENSQPILITVSGSEEPLIVKEILPTIEGVVIIASGAENVAVKLELQKAVQTLLNVPTSNIEILVGK